MGRMTPTETMAALEQAGTAQAVKIYKRHGAAEPLFGVSYANLDKLRRSIGVDHELALALWETGNHDARILATKIADPDRLGKRDLDSWVRVVDNYMQSDALADLVGRGPEADSRADKWTTSPREFVAHTGWALVGQQALRDDDRPAAYFGERIDQIEAGIKTAPNRTRHAMWMTLIAIGGRTPGLRRKAEAAAKRIGTPTVDHGQTSCTTPDALPYIERMWERKLVRQ